MEELIGWLTLKTWLSRNVLLSVPAPQIDYKGGKCAITDKPLGESINQNNITLKPILVIFICAQV